jgi:hypothetical protein
LKFKLTTSAITCHWIDESWKLHDALLDFKHVPGHHSGDVLGDEVFDILEEYSITEKLFCITTDNAGNNGTMMRRVSKRLLEEKQINWDPKVHHISCLNHVINLAVQDFLKEIKGLAQGDVEDDSDDESMPAEIGQGFSCTMWKIRTITKVCAKCNVQMNF